MDAASLLIPFITAAKLRPILASDGSRHPALPNVPTATELGIKDFVVTVFVGLSDPPKMPADIVRKADPAMNAALVDLTVNSMNTKNGDLVGGGSPERVAIITPDDYKRWGEAHVETKSVWTNLAIASRIRSEA